MIFVSADTSDKKATSEVRENCFNYAKSCSFALFLYNISLKACIECDLNIPTDQASTGNAVW